MEVQTDIHSTEPDKMSPGWMDISCTELYCSHVVKTCPHIEHCKVQAALKSEKETF